MTSCINSHYSSPGGVADITRARFMLPWLKLQAAKIKFQPIMLSSEDLSLLISFCRASCFMSVGLRKTLSMHYSPILEMLLYHEYFLRGTEEKCFCAAVYDKQFLLHSTVADTPIMRIQ